MDLVNHNTLLEEEEKRENCTVGLLKLPHIRHQITHCRRCLACIHAIRAAARIGLLPSAAAWLLLAALAPDVVRGPCGRLGVGGCACRLVMSFAYRSNSAAANSSIHSTHGRW
jgi:hypothetical protein